MRRHPNRDRGLLQRVDQALDEKVRTGRADEARYGLVAQVANAAPPIDEALRRTLRARVLAGETGDAQRLAVQGRAQTVRLRRSALLALAAVLSVALVFLYAQKVTWPELTVGRSGSAGPPAGEDVDALAEALNGASGPRTVIVYPEGGAPIAEHVQHKTLPLVLGKDRTPAAIRGALGMILPSGGFVDLVMVGAEADDTTRQVREGIEQTLYRLYRPGGQPEVETYGALERSTFVAGPLDTALEPIGAVFEGGIELVGGSVLDDPQPGMPLRMAFDWRIQDPVDESLVVFVHLVRGDAELVAQRDAVPGNGLFPVESWRPGELVRDQFALLLPALPAGEVEIRVGIYDATTGMRRSLLGPENGTYVVVRQVEVR